jgi:hypothetical protein
VETLILSSNQRDILALLESRHFLHIYPDHANNLSVDQILRTILILYYENIIQECKTLQDSIAH